MLQKKIKGFSLIEVLVSLLIIMILTIGIYSLIILALNVSHDNKAYIGATALANQKMEQIRNLPYDDVGTVSGAPSGSIPDNETIVREATFDVHTVIAFYDDDYDGKAASTTPDPVFTDYKIATVDVSWQSKFGDKHVTLFSKIIPRTIETDIGYGLLKIIVVDANGDPVPSANIHIENNIIAPTISVDLVSDVNGELYYSAPPSFEGYEITVTKAGYGIDKTYERDGVVRGIVNANPTKPHLSLQAGLLTEESFQIDVLGYLDIWTVYQDLPDNWEIINDTSGEPQVNARIIFDNLDNVYVVWEDYADASKSKIHAQKYQSDGTPIWPSDVVVAPSSDTILPDIQLDQAGNLYISWADDSVGQKEVYLVSLLSSNGNDRWGGEKKINTTWNSNQYTPRIALLENQGPGTATTSIVWVDDKWTQYDIFLNLYSYDGTAIILEKKINDTTNP
ncbi:prepilin-type N-terminal cleavage/methylation domain-containing protein, partial [Patescibacteria group bacterium]